MSTNGAKRMAPEPREDIEVTISVASNGYLITRDEEPPDGLLVVLSRQELFEWLEANLRCPASTAH